MAAVIVKIGGSHAFDSALAGWMASISSADAAVIVVAGGGPFADAVRRAQPAIGFGDDAAHRMAILGMAQFAEALASSFSLPLVSSKAQTEAASRGTGATVWSPIEMALDDQSLPHTWDLTSDSIAAWLATRLESPALVLVKQALPPTSCIEDATALGLVDPLFAAFAGVYGGPTWLVGPGGEPALRALLAGETPAGCAIRLTPAESFRRTA